MTLSDEETAAVNIQSSHAIDIIAFVEVDDIPLSCFETPYYLAPAPGDEKVYALLREALNRTRKIGIAHVMIQARRRIAALIPCGPVLMLNTLRVADNASSLVRANVHRKLVKAATPTEKELATAAQVVESMTHKWDMSRCPDTFDVDDTAPDPGCRPADILRPRVRLPSEGSALEDRSGCRAQRESRPRPRTPRTYH